MGLQARTLIALMKITIANEFTWKNRTGTNSFKYRFTNKFHIGFIKITDEIMSRHVTNQRNQCGFKSVMALSNSFSSVAFCYSNHSSLDFPTNFELNITSESFLLNTDEICLAELNALCLAAQVNTENKSNSSFLNNW